jgi:MFS transporter, UMF1 family
VSNAEQEQNSPGWRLRVLRRLSLQRPEQRGWALYDFANSAFITTIVAAIFPIYFQKVAAADLSASQATSLYSWSTTLALLATALINPLLGPLGDFLAWRKRFFAAFLVLGVSATAGLFCVQQGDAYLGAWLFGLANVGAAGSFVFYDALLPHVARPEEMDRLSSTGYSLGYLGGGLLLGLNLAWIQNPHWFGLPSGEGLSPADATLPTRLAFLSVAVWWALFAVPLFRQVPEPPRFVEADESATASGWLVAFTRLRETFTELRRHRDAGLMLLAFLFYNDGISTIFRMAALFGAQRGLPTGTLISAILVVQIMGVPCALLFATLARKFSTKGAILFGVCAYLGITLLAFGMRTETHFMILAVAVGLVMGGTQALSRSLFSSLIPKHKSSEYFALFGILEKFAGIFGPLVFALTAAALPAGRQHFAVLTITPFFLIGGLLLATVNVTRGQARARALEEATRAL